MVMNIIKWLLLVTWHNRDSSHYITFNLIQYAQRDKESLPYFIYFAKIFKSLYIL